MQYVDWEMEMCAGGAGRGELTSRWMALTVTCFSVPEGTRILVKLLSMRGQYLGPGRSVAPCTCHTPDGST